MDAHLVRDWLERNGIVGIVRGQDLLGAAGEIPVLWPTVWVSDQDEVRAQEAIRTYEGPALVHPDWICAACGEENGPAFGACWACGAEPSGEG